LFSVEQIAQKTPLFMMMAMLVLFLMVFIAFVLALSLVARRAFGNRALNNPIKFPSIEPDPPALRTIIDLNSLALRHLKNNTAGWAIHFFPPG
jgi:hypothetical protein